MRLAQRPLTDLDGAPGVAMSLLSRGTTAEHVRVDLAVLQPGASLPKHPAGQEQVFYVVTGEGRVAADDGVEHPVSAGWAVTWEPGEQHTSWADTTMTVVIIQRRGGS
ncbi:cupin domain-containing protein [Actinotalea sp. BY-33]|uniref:Cupin domain-containing protein n=1 Tax=Actinotalea soli TaxID=2819234 RepID=A0A939LU42_9CELL|nr:cupin domain-containing protein [Actinotalea soli]MBO1751337.1 cupin domain-containing protein [Actinotalea soli]